MQDKAARDKQEKEIARRQNPKIAIVKSGQQDSSTQKKIDVGDPSPTLLVRGLIPEFTEEIMRYFLSVGFFFSITQEASPASEQHSFCSSFIFNQVQLDTKIE